MNNEFLKDSPINVYIYEMLKMSYYMYVQYSVGGFLMIGRRSIIEFQEIKIEDDFTVSSVRNGTGSDKNCHYRTIQTHIQSWARAITVAAI